MENRSSIWEELEVTPDNVKQYLKDVFRDLLPIPYFIEWVDVHAGYGSPSATSYIINKLKEFAV